MSKQIKTNEILVYANLKLHELEILNEIRKHIQEMCNLRDDGIMVGVDVDVELKRIKFIYKNLLNLANQSP